TLRGFCSIQACPNLRKTPKSPKNPKSPKSPKNPSRAGPPSRSTTAVVCRTNARPTGRPGNPPWPSTHREGKQCLLPTPNPVFWKSTTIRKQKNGRRTSETRGSAGSDPRRAGDPAPPAADDVPHVPRAGLLRREQARCADRLRTCPVASGHRQG